MIRDKMELKSHDMRFDHAKWMYQFSVKISLRAEQTMCDWLGFMVQPIGKSNSFSLRSAQLQRFTMNCRAILVQPFSQQMRVSQISTATSSILAQLRISANQLLAIVLNLYSYWMSPLSSSQSSYIEPCWQKVMGLSCPNLWRGITFCCTLSTLTLPSMCPLKGVRKKLSELSLISVISMSLGFSMDFQCSACLTNSRSGKQLMLLGCGSAVLGTKDCYLLSQLMNSSAFLALQTRLTCEFFQVMMQSFWLKTMVGGLNNLHSSAIVSMSSEGESPASWKAKCQLSSDASNCFIQYNQDISESMELLQSYDFLTGVNPTIKTLVYLLILIHLLAVTAWCVYACPKMFAKTESFSDKVEKALKEKKN